MTPIADTPCPSKQAKIVFISLFEQNKHTICGHLVTPYIFMILVIKNFMTPLFFFPRIYDPPVYLGPPSKENASPLYHIQHVFSRFFFSLSLSLSLGQGRSQPHSPGWARVSLSSLFLKFRSIFLIFYQTLLIFFFILALRVGDSPTRKDPGYATALGSLLRVFCRY